MKKLFFSLIFILITIPLIAFPLKKLKKGDIIDIKSLNPVNSNGEKYKEKNIKKLLFLWRHDKRLSVKSARKFVKVCKERKILCISVEIKRAPIKKLLKILGNVPSNIYFAQNPPEITDWGIFTLPVTIFLNEKNKIINAIGYEGQYVTKVEKYLDYLEGKISKSEYEKYSNAEVSYKRSLLPDFNFILELINNHQINEAKKKLSELKINNLNDFEKLAYCKILIKLNDLDKAIEVIKTVNPYNPKAKFYKGIILYKQKKYDDSIKIFKEIKNIFPDKRALFYFMGKVYMKKGDCKNAAKYFEKSFDFINIDF